MVTQAIDAELRPLETNPRVSSGRLESLWDLILRDAPEIVDQVKGLLGNTTLEATHDSQRNWQQNTSTEVPMRYPARAGTHPELDVVVDDLRVRGRLDLLVVDGDRVIITDFKTGSPHDRHADQLRMYALLWQLDRQVNPQSRPATELRIVYSSHVATVEVPAPGLLKQLEAAIEDRVQEADANTHSPNPAALPSEDNCAFCEVRHMCGDYWSSIPPSVAQVPIDQWFDFQGRILRRNGTRSWHAQTLGEPPYEVLIRTVDASLEFDIGQSVRLLGVRRSQDADDPRRLAVAMVSTSEWYAIAGNSD